MPLTDALLLDPAPFNVWIAVRTDGIQGSGTTPGDPFDGSTQPRFDAVMQTIAAQFPAKKVAIHLGPDTFETKGYPNTGGWQIKAGMRILGSGIQLTTLKLVTPASGQNYAIGHDLGSAIRADLSEVMDLTIDCNLPTTGSVAVCSAVRLMGD